MIPWPEEFLGLAASDIEFDGTLDAQKFQRWGVAVVRGLLGASETDRLVAAMSESTAKPLHPVSWEVPDPMRLIEVPLRRRLAALLEEVLGPDIGLTGARFLRKPGDGDVRVPTHQDVGYHVGELGQVSVFCALAPSNSASGGVQAVIGSHHLGYLGDAGRLSAFYPAAAVVAPDLKEGDALVMHCACAHFSEANRTTRERALLEILLCPSSQSWRIESLLDDGPSVPRHFADLDPGQAARLFTSGRVQRLRAIRQALEGTGEA